MHRPIRRFGILHSWILSSPIKERSVFLLLFVNSFLALELARDINLASKIEKNVGFALTYFITVEMTMSNIKSNLVVSVDPLESVGFECNFRRPQKLTLKPLLSFPPHKPYQ